MNNLQRILKYASQNNYVKFEETIQNELAKRISTRLENNKKEIASNLFKEQTK